MVRYHLEIDGKEFRVSDLRWSEEVTPLEPVKVKMQFQHSTYGDLNHKRDMEKLGWEHHSFEDIPSRSQYHYDTYPYDNPRIIASGRNPIKVHSDPPNARRRDSYDNYIIQSEYLKVCNNLEYAKREISNVIQNTKEYISGIYIYEVDEDLSRGRRPLRFCPVTGNPYRVYLKAAGYPEPYPPECP